MNRGCKGQEARGKCFRGGVKTWTSASWLNVSSASKADNSGSSFAGYCTCRAPLNLHGRKSRDDLSIATSWLFRTRISKPPLALAALGSHSWHMCDDDRRRERTESNISGRKKKTALTQNHLDTLKITCESWWDGSSRYLKGNVVVEG